MKNKYQEALDEVENDLYYHSPKDEVTVKRQDKMIKTLQELIDKETPMKIKEEWVGGDDDDYIRHLCPKCNIDVFGYEDYCERCGQKLDWGDE